MFRPSYLTTETGPSSVNDNIFPVFVRISENDLETLSHENVRTEIEINETESQMPLEVYASDNETHDNIQNCVDDEQSIMATYWNTKKPLIDEAIEKYYFVEEEKEIYEPPQVLQPMGVEQVSMTLNTHQKLKVTKQIRRTRRQRKLFQNFVQRDADDCSRMLRSTILPPVQNDPGTWGDEEGEEKTLIDEVNDNTLRPLVVESFKSYDYCYKQVKPDPRTKLYSQIMGVTMCEQVYNNMDTKFQSRLLCVHKARQALKALVEFGYLAHNIKNCVDVPKEFKRMMKGTIQSCYNGEIYTLDKDTSWNIMWFSRNWFKFSYPPQLWKRVKIFIKLAKPGGKGDVQEVIDSFRSSVEYEPQGFVSDFVSNVQNKFVELATQLVQSAVTKTIWSVLKTAVSALGDVFASIGHKLFDFSRYMKNKLKSAASAVLKIMGLVVAFVLLIPSIIMTMSVMFGNTMANLFELVAEQLAGSISGSDYVSTIFKSYFSGKETWGSDPSKFHEQSDRDTNNFVAGLISLAATVAGLQVSDPQIKNLCSFFAKSRHTGSLVTFFADRSQEIAYGIAYFVTQDTKYLVFDELNEVRKLMKDANDIFSDPMVMQYLMADQDMIKRVQNLFQNMSDKIIVVQTNKYIEPSVRLAFTRSFEAVKAAHNKIYENSVVYTGRKMPAWLYLMGAPGVGKTNMVTGLLSRTHHFMQKKFPDDPLYKKKFSAAKKFCKAHLSDYSEGYTHQWVYEIDELFASTEPTKRSQASAELTSIVNDGVCALNMAFGAKGEMFFSSEIVVSTTNLERLDNIYLESIPALTRRMSFPLRCEQVEKLNQDTYDNLDKSWKLFVMTHIGDSPTVPFPGLLKRAYARTALEKGDMTQPFVRFRDVSDALIEFLIDLHTVPSLGARMNNIDWDKYEEEYRNPLNISPPDYTPWHFAEPKAKEEIDEQVDFNFMKNLTNWWSKEKKEDVDMNCELPQFTHDNKTLEEMLQKYYCIYEGFDRSGQDEFAPDLYSTLLEEFNIANYASVRVMVQKHSRNIINDKTIAAFVYSLLQLEEAHPIMVATILVDFIERMDHPVPFIQPHPKSFVEHLGNMFDRAFWKVDIIPDETVNRFTKNLMNFVSTYAHDDYYTTVTVGDDLESVVNSHNLKRAKDAYFREFANTSLGQGEMSVGELTGNSFKTIQVMMAQYVYPIMPVMVGMVVDSSIGVDPGLLELNTLINPFMMYVINNKFANVDCGEELKTFDLRTSWNDFSGLKKVCIGIAAILTVLGVVLTFAYGVIPYITKSVLPDYAHEHVDNTMNRICALKITEQSLQKGNEAKPGKQAFRNVEYKVQGDEEFIFKNIVFVKVECDDHSFFTNGLMLRPGQLVMTRHGTRGKGVSSITFYTTDGNFGATIRSDSFVTKYNLDRDLLFVRIRPGILQPCPDITSHLLPAPIAKMEGLFVRAEKRTNGNMLSRKVIQGAEIEFDTSTNFTSSNLGLEFKNLYKFINMPGATGDCGFPYMGKHMRSLNIQFPIFGLHQGSVGNDGLVVPLYNSDVLSDTDMAQLFQVQAIDLPMRIDSEIFVEVEEQVNLPGLFAIGKVKKPVHQSVQSEYRRTPLVPTEEFPLMVRPAPLKAFTTKDGVIHNPFLENLKFQRNLTVGVNFNNPVLNEFAESPVIYEGFDGGIKHNVSDISIEDACLGNPERGILPLDETTSPGFNPPGGCTTRKQLFRKADRFIHSELRRRVNLRRKWARRGFSHATITQLTLKDELMEALYKARIFCNVELEAIVHAKIVLGDLVSKMKKNWCSTFCAVGVNPHSIDWKFIREKVYRFGASRIIGGDFSGFDATLKRWLLGLFFCMCNSHYNYSSYSPDWYELLAVIQSTFSCIGVWFDSAYQSLASNSSGNWLTSFINSFCSFAIFKLIFVLTRTSSDFKFEECFSGFFYGDDNLGGIREDVDFFDNEVIAVYAKELFGMTYTSPSKGLVESPFLTEGEVGFLGRTFRVDGDFTWAPLRHTALNGMLFWTRDKSDTLEIFYSNLNNVLMECHHYGEDMFNKYYSFIVRALKDLGMRPCESRTYKYWHGRMRDVYYRNDFLSAHSLDY